MRHTLAQVTALTLFVSALGCGDVPIEVEGDTGQDVAISLIDDIPAIASTFEKTEKAPFLIDTGSPLTVVSGHLLPEQSGTRRGDLAAFDLRFLSLPVEVAALFSPSELCDEVTPGGLVGADLLGSYELSVDVQRKTAALSEDEPAEPFGDHAEKAHTVPFELLGGGTVTIGDSKRSIGATRVVVPVTVEGIKTYAVVDSGATVTLLDGRLFGSLSAEGRPVACCQTLLLQGRGETRLNLTRVRTLDVDGVAVKNVPAAVLPNGVLTNALSKETGREIRVVLGASLLRHFAYHLSYARKVLRLQRYRDDTLHIDAREYVRPGFSFCKAKDAANGIFVTEVFDGSDAAAQGVTAGARVVAIADQDITTLDDSEITALFRKIAPGDSVALTFDTPSGRVPLTITVQDILPEFGD